MRASSPDRDADQHEAPDWRARALARSLGPAWSRATDRALRYVDAAFAVIDEKDSTEFTIQEVVDRSGQSLRGFYATFAGKDELVLALLEEIVHEALADIRVAVDAEVDPVARLRTGVVRLHEWCDPDDHPRPRGRRPRRAISELSMQLAGNHADRMRAALAPVGALLGELVEAASGAGAISVPDPRRAAAFLQQTVMYSWFGNRLVDDRRRRVSADETWEFCFRGLRGGGA